MRSPIVGLLIVGIALGAYGVASSKVALSVGGACLALLAVVLWLLRPGGARRTGSESIDSGYFDGGGIGSTPDAHGHGHGDAGGGDSGGGGADGGGGH